MSRASILFSALVGALLLFPTGSVAATGTATSIASFDALADTSDAETGYVVFYFGATSCGPCNRPETIDAIKRINADFSQAHGERPVKHVMVAMDRDIRQGFFSEKVWRVLGRGVGGQQIPKRDDSSAPK